MATFTKSQTVPINGDIPSPLLSLFAECSKIQFGGQNVYMLSLNMPFLPKDEMIILNVCTVGCNNIKWIHDKSRNLMYIKNEKEITPEQMADYLSYKGHKMQKDFSSEIKKYKQYHDKYIAQPKIQKQSYLDMLRKSSDLSLIHI